MYTVKSLLKIREAFIKTNVKPSLTPHLDQKKISKSALNS